MSKFYLPQESINANYLYTTDGSSILVRTNNNCFSQYNTYYCDCYYVYPSLDYLQSQVNQCSRNVSYTLNYNMFTSDWVYRLDVDKIFVISTIIFLLIFLLVYKPIARLFGRWLKL